MANNQSSSKSGSKSEQRKTSTIRITTKTGDSGQTGLANGQRLSKAALTFDVVGDLDELNSWLGVVVVQFGAEFHEIQSFLTTVQDTLFYIGAEVAQSPKAKLSAKHITDLEKQSKKIEKKLEDNWHTKFVLPGGTQLGAWIDVARTVCRRCERSMVKLNQEQDLNPELVKYINRLSDYLYLVRCFVNQKLEYQEKQFVAK